MFDNMKSWVPCFRNLIVVVVVIIIIFFLFNGGKKFIFVCRLPKTEQKQYPPLFDAIYIEKKCQIFVRLEMNDGS